MFISNVSVFLAAISGFHQGEIAEKSNKEEGLIGSYEVDSDRIWLSKKEVSKIHKRF